MIGITPPPNTGLHETGFCGSETTVVNPKSARHARGGVSFVMRMSSYHGVRKLRTPGGVPTPTPLMHPWTILMSCRYFSPCAASCS